MHEIIFSSSVFELDEWKLLCEELTVTFVSTSSKLSEVVILHAETRVHFSNRPLNNLPKFNQASVHYSDFCSEIFAKN